VRIPLPGTLSSSAGPLSLSGTVHVVVPGNPIQPGDPVRVQTNLVQVTASIDQASCSARGAQSFTLDTATTPFTGSYPIQPSEPCRELGASASTTS
jgi:hypothetical protein